MQIALLIGPARADGAALGADRRRGFGLGACLQHGLDVGVLQRQVYALGRDDFLGAGFEQAVENPRGRLGRALGANDGEVVASVGDFDTQPALDLAEMVIELSAQAGEPLVVVRLQLELEGRQGTRQGDIRKWQGKDRTPRRASSVRAGSWAWPR